MFYQEFWFWIFIIGLILFIISIIVYELTKNNASGVNVWFWITFSLAFGLIVISILTYVFSPDYEVSDIVRYVPFTPNNVYNPTQTKVTTSLVQPGVTNPVVVSTPNGVAIVPQLPKPDITTTTNITVVPVTPPAPTPAIPISQLANQSVTPIPPKQPLSSLANSTSNIPQSLSSQASNPSQVLTTNQQVESMIPIHI
jgi:hypothetical protein